MNTIHNILQHHWGHSEFRPLQEDIIQSVLLKNDTLALMPTGGGKSICFQVPGLAMKGTAIVISPLIALMKDQVEQLKRRDITAAAIYSGMTKREIDIILDNCIYGNIKFLYVSPERLETEIFQERVKKMKVSLIAVDEAHCISQWGYDFRPAYLNIINLREILKNTPVIALTATATEEVKKDIQNKLQFKNGKVFQKSFFRKNLSYSCFEEEGKEKKVLEILKNVRGSSIVYVRSRKKTEDIASYLNRKNIPATFYHAGLVHSDRSSRQESWISGGTRVIVATNAFGMGIDKPDVRTVIHWDIPDSLEAYYQEAGRAGRDEKKSYAVLLFNNNDLEVLKDKIEESYPSIDFIRKVYQSLANYFKIAVGSSNMTSYDFQIEELLNIYKLPRLETYYAIKRLESEGFIQLNEGFYLPSRIMFLVNQKELYEFQVSNEKQDTLLKMILRMYGGEAFTNFVNISEKDLAKNLHSTTEEITQLLKTLHKYNIVEYDQQKERSQLVFTTPRMDASKLPLDVKKIEQRKKTSMQKINSVIHYSRQKERCRAIVLLDYFGEISDNECGVCDICIQKKKQKEDKNYEELRSQILKMLTEESVKTDDLIQKINPQKKDLIIDVVRIMLDAGEISFNKENFLFIKKLLSSD
ncbi:MAG: RecQ family ATP-dependent DNA helicase [Cytophagaceae bacterium]|nr:RecQ family ATP-dependent DNA helicase [Cytophagaceae bacterium]